jgi:hypothetical protein
VVLLLFDVVLVVVVLVVVVVVVVVVVDELLRPRLFDLPSTEGTTIMLVSKNIDTVVINLRMIVI